MQRKDPSSNSMDITPLKINITQLKINITSLKINITQLKIDTTTPKTAGITLSLDNRHYITNGQHTLHH